MSNFQATRPDGQEIELKFIEPTAAILSEASKIYSKTFTELLESGSLLRKKLAENLRKQGLWSDEQQEELDTLQRNIVEKEHQLHKGGIKLSDAKELALSIQKDRARQGELLASYNEYDNMTVEGQADNARFNYLVYACTVYSKTGKQYFESYDEFVSYKDPVAFIAAAKYGKEYYNLDDNYQLSLPENQFLKKFKFVDDDLRLINKEGKLVNEDGELINEFGNRVDEEGHIIDNFGFVREEDGSFADESSPFLDDDGNPVTVDSEAKPKPKRGRKKATPVAAEDSA